MRILKLCLCVLVTLLVGSSRATAQFDSAVVLGTVRDGSGAVVPGAAITLRNVDTGLTSSAVTDSNGSYQLLNVRIGTYEVTGELSGFSAAIAKDVGVAINARQRVDLTLQIAGMSDEVVVTADAQLLETDSSERGQVIEREQIINLPLNGRTYSSLALLSAGVMESNQNGVGTSGREGSFNTNGLRNTANNFQLDGVDNNAYGIRSIEARPGARHCRTGSPPVRIGRRPECPRHKLVSLRRKYLSRSTDRAAPSGARSQHQYPELSVKYIVAFLQSGAD